MYKDMKTVIIFVVFVISLCLGNSMLHKVYEESVRIPCETSLDCEFNEECNAVDSFCQCRAGENCTTLTNSVVTTKIGETCQRDSDCNIQDAFCHVNNDSDSKACLCLDGHVIAASGKLCLKVLNSLADPCQEDIQCETNIADSICLQNICVCSYGMHDYNNTCHQDRALGDSCHSSAECTTPYSECHDSVCTCSRRYIPSNDGHECLLAAISLLSSCKRDEQCRATLGSGSHCYNDLCNCMYMYQFKPSAKRCVRDMTLGETCSNHFDCHQPGSDSSRLVCILNECQCQTPIFVQEDGNCIESNRGSKPSGKISALPFIIIFLGNLLFLAVLLQ